MNIDSGFPTGPIYPTFANELLEARCVLSLSDHIGLALRAHRHQLHQSQRAYATHRHWNQTHIARLETAASTQRLADILDALKGTGYTLALVTCDADAGDDARTDTNATGLATDTPDRQAPPTIVQPAHWPTPELIARVRGRRRRFPAHHTTHRTSTAPQWWFHNESTYSFDPPHWTTTPPHLDLGLTPATRPRPDNGHACDEGDRHLGRCPAVTRQGQMQPVSRLDPPSSNEVRHLNPVEPPGCAERSVPAVGIRHPGQVADLAPRRSATRNTPAPPER